MAVHKIKKGLSLPIAGEPEQTIEDAKPPSHVALIAADYHGMKPTMQVQVGDVVKRGQLLFDDKKTPGVRYTSIAGGKVTAVNRGARRALQSVVIELDNDEQAGKAETIAFESATGKSPSELSEEQVRALLLESGLWTALRARPFSRVADPATRPSSVFVTAIDSNPLAPDVSVILRSNEDDFQRGLVVLSKLTDGSVFVCAQPGAGLPMPTEARVRLEEFTGPHPAGTPGLHIHTLDPVDRSKSVWYVGCQDVVAIGKLFHRGELDVSRVVSLAGPPVKNPRLLRTRLGASTDALTAGELEDGDLRLISGSVFSGRTAQGDIEGYLGRYHQQVSVLAEGREREFLGWLAPGTNRFSLTRAFLGALTPGKKRAFTTSTNGSERAIVPVGTYEKVFPLDILPSFLTRALAVGDLEQALELGALELDEEDVALLSFVCPSKDDYGVKLRDVLTTIEKEG
ncbi:MAG: Na(+)-translocating NADH-quinone reductase subunit A [Acidobacteriota bacterium]